MTDTPNYIIDFYNFQLDGNPLEENGIVTNAKHTKNEAKEKARRNCKKCFGRGFLYFDHDAKKFSYTQYCSCVINKIEREEKLKALEEKASHPNIVKCGFNPKYNGRSWDFENNVWEETASGN